MLTAAAGLCATAALADTSVRDWVYGDGDVPEKWSIANEDYAACDAGAMQSPIDLNMANAYGDIDVAASYGTAPGDLKLGPGKVQVDVEPGMGMISGGDLFNLLQMHFHTPAEHALDGTRYPLVLHLVHATSEGRLGVLGVMFKEGEANPALDAIVQTIDADEDDLELDVGALVPEELAVYRYMGSLTTPPCTEGVNWHVAEEVLTASAAQIEAMEARLGTSNRSLQPLNGRLVVAPSN
ncbi:carbonic anhydrase family protein [Pacificimonas aurantium]|nr:carbonic anhydrase family protein [Pacificimonas aurantium]